MSYNEYPDSAYFPQNLRTEHIKDPYLVLYEFFDYCGLPEVRRIFWEFFKAAVTGKFNKESYKYVRVSIVELYEKIQKLIEASHLINEEYKKRKALQVSEVTDIQYLSNFCKKQHEEKIIQIITDSVKPKRIYRLCSIDAYSQHEPKYDYLVVVPENSPQNFDDIKELIENACLELPPIFVSFVKENQLPIDLGN